MDRRLNVFIPILLFLFITVILPYLPGFYYDNHDCWEAWAHYIFQNGLRNAYGSGTDYMPVYQYSLWAYVKWCGNDKAITDNLAYLRCITLAFDFLGIWFVFKWIDKKLAYYTLLCMAILNISYAYDTLIWGQMDGTLSALVFAAVYFAWKRSNLWSMIFLVLAFNFKVQTIVILPVWGLLFLNNYFISRKATDLVYPVLAAAGLQALLVLPFTLGNYGVGQIVHVVIKSFSKYESVSIKAANFWHWVVKGELLYANDKTVWVAGLTYKQAGLLLFFTCAFFALLPLLKLVWHNMRGAVKPLVIRRELVWTTGAMVYLLFYFLNTEIHERYCHPAFIFITAYAFFTSDLLSYVLFSAMYFLTLEVSQQHLKLHNYELLLFDFRFLACITAVIIINMAFKIGKYYRLSVAEGKL